MLSLSLSLIILYYIYFLHWKVKSHHTNKVIDKTKTSKEIIDWKQAEAKYQVGL